MPVPTAIVSCYFIVIFDSPMQIILTASFCAESQIFSIFLLSFVGWPWPYSQNGVAKPLNIFPLSIYKSKISVDEI